jgi:hypothetical protein
MAQFNVPVTINGQQMMVPVEAQSAEEAKRAVLEKYGTPAPSAPAQPTRIGETFGAGAATGVGDVIDMLLTPVTGAIYLGRKATGSLDEDATFFGDDGFADLSGAISKGAQDKLGPLNKTEESLFNFGRVTGGVVAGMGAGLLPVWAQVGS